MHCQITAILIVTLAIGVIITHGQSCPSSYCGGDLTQRCCSLTPINSTTVQASCCAAPTTCCTAGRCCPSNYPVCCNENECCQSGTFCCIVGGQYKCCSWSKSLGNNATDPQPAQGASSKLVRK